MRAARQLVLPVPRARQVRVKVKAIVKKPSTGKATCVASLHLHRVSLLSESFRDEVTPVRLRHRRDPQDLLIKWSTQRNPPGCLSYAMPRPTTHLHDAPPTQP